MSLEKKTEELHALKLQAVNDYIQKMRTQTTKLFEACKANNDKSIQSTFEEIAFTTNQYEELLYDMGCLQAKIKKLGGKEQ